MAVVTGEDDHLFASRMALEDRTHFLRQENRAAPVVRNAHGFECGVQMADAAFEPAEAVRGLAAARMPDISREKALVARRTWPARISFSWIRPRKLWRTHRRGGFEKSIARTSACSTICAPASSAALAKPTITLPGSTVPPGTIRATLSSPESFQEMSECFRTGSESLVA